MYIKLRFGWIAYQLEMWQGFLVKLTYATSCKCTEYRKENL